MEMLRRLHLYLLGPRLLRLHKTENRSGSRYHPNFAERIGAKVLGAFRLTYGVAKTLSPVVLLMLYRHYKQFLAQGPRSSLPVSNDNSTTVYAEPFDALRKLTVYYSSYAALLFCVIAIAICIRAVGRASNPVYCYFVSSIVRAASPALSLTDKYQVSNRFDFTPYEMPAIFQAQPLPRDTPRFCDNLGDCADGSFGSKYSLYHIICYAAIHSFGKRMLYPGTVHALQYMFMDELVRGRGSLVEKHAGIRRRILTADKNYIDTMFVDRRSGTTALSSLSKDTKVSHSRDFFIEEEADSDEDGPETDVNKKPAEKVTTVADQSAANPSTIESVKGKFLVICCEGNSGFYEVGLTSSPIAGGYSVLGWNHPGFIESTGTPFPSQEVHAIDAVMQYAVKELGFPVENIIIYAWSIGGFTACWAAKLYPRIRTLILDATFDNVLHLARTRFPPSFSGLLEYAIKHYCHLNMDELLDDFDGPLVLIRRLEDEIIVTGAPGDFRYNRCNNLLVKVLKQRFPLVFEHAEQIDDESEPPHGSSADERRPPPINDRLDPFSSAVDLDRIGPLRLLRMYLEASPREKQILLQRFQLTQEKARIVADVIRRKRQALQRDGSSSASVFPITEHDLFMSDDDSVLAGGGSAALKRQLLMGLADIYMKDIPLSHCMPLPQKVFDQLVPCFDDDIDHNGFFGYQER